jgi:hypothetical protein
MESSTMVTTSSFQNETPHQDFVARVPLRLYESNGTIFELYDGGRPYQQMAIRWTHLESIEGMESQAPEFHRRLEDK